MVKDGEKQRVHVNTNKYFFFFSTEYAQVTKMLGNGRLEAMCFDGVKRLCHIRGKLRKKVWINQGDIILIGLRDYQDAKADVILKYTSDEARNLKTYGEFPETGKLDFNKIINIIFQTAKLIYFNLSIQCASMIPLHSLRMASMRTSNLVMTLAMMMKMM